MITSHEKTCSLGKLLLASDFLRVLKFFIIANRRIKMIEGNRITLRGHFATNGKTYKHNLK